MSSQGFDSLLLRVELAGQLSIHIAIKCSIPHSSILGPLHFIICTSPIKDDVELRDCHMSTYMSMTSRQHSLSTQCQLSCCKAGNIHLQHLGWIVSNQLKLDKSKTEILWFTTTPANPLTAAIRGSSYKIFDKWCRYPGAKLVYNELCSAAPS